MIILTKDKTMGADYGDYDGEEQIGKYFKLKEFLRTDHPNISNAPSPEHYANLKDLAFLLDQFREMFGPITIISGYRSPEYNEWLLENGTAAERSQVSTTSLHTKGQAADITFSQYPATSVYAMIANDENWPDAVGEFAIKENLIHMSTPTMTKKGVLMYVDEAGAYIRFQADQLAKFIQDYLPNQETIASTVSTVTATASGFSRIMIPIGILAVLGVAAIYIVKKRKAGKFA